MKLGDAIATVATPIARIMNLDCIDPETHELKPDSGCAQRKQTLNDWGDVTYDWLFQPKGDK
jgi:hypothetical protein